MSSKKQKQIPDEFKRVIFESPPYVEVPGKKVSSSFIAQFKASMCASLLQKLEEVIMLE